MNVSIRHSIWQRPERINVKIPTFSQRNNKRDNITKRSRMSTTSIWKQCGNTSIWTTCYRHACIPSICDTRVPRTHTHMHYTCAHIHTCTTHTHMRIYTHTLHTRARTHTHMHYTRAHTHTCTIHTRAHIHYTHTHTHTHTCTTHTLQILSYNGITGDRTWLLESDPSESWRLLNFWVIFLTTNWPASFISIASIDSWRNPP